MKPVAFFRKYHRLEDAAEHIYVSLRLGAWASWTVPLQALAPRLDLNPLATRLR